jgi:hypothetical protein
MRIPSPVYVLPQLDAKAFWRAKRLAPGAFTRSAGLLGYTSTHIAELLTAWANGEDLADVLGLERLIRPWAADEPATTTLRQVRALAGD